MVMVLTKTDLDSCNGITHILIKNADWNW